MKKAIKSLFKIFFLFVIFFVMKDVKAYSTYVTSTNNTINQGEELILKINISGLEKKLGSATYYLSYDKDAFSYLSSNFKGVVANNPSILKLTYENQIAGIEDGVFAILTFKVKNINKNDTFTFNLTSENTKDIESFDIISSNTGINIKVENKSNINTLDDLTVNGDSINFKKDIHTYDLKVDTDKVVINAIKSNSLSKVFGLGTKELQYGENTFNIIVEAKDSSKRTYSLHITRIDNRNSNNYLQTLTVGKDNISLYKSQNVYNLVVDSDISSINVKATLESKSAGFVKNYSPRVVDLDFGKNKIILKVKAENGSVREYILNITRTDGRSNNANLSNIVLSSSRVDFNKNMMAYQIAVNNDVKTLNIKAIPEDEHARVDVEETLNLKEGANVTKIKVSAENGNTKSYKLTVIRANDNQTPTDNTYLKELTIKGYNVAFNKEVYAYNVEIKDEEQLEIIALAEEPTSMVMAEGNENLKNGSKIIIKVIAEDSTVGEYIINIKKHNAEKDNNISNNISPIALIVFVVGIVSFIGSIVYRVKLRKSK